VLTGSLLQLLRRRLWVILVTTAVALEIAIVALIMLLPAAYAATSTVRLGTVVPAGPGGTSYDLYYSDRLINTYKTVLTARPAIEQMRARVASETGQRLPVHPKVSVKLPPNTELIELTVRASSPRLAAAAANALAATMIDDVQTWAAQQRPALTVRAQVVEAAQPSSAERVPGMAVTLGLAGLLGVVGGFALVLALQRARPVLLTPDAVASATGLPLLGHVDSRAPDRAEALLLRIALQLGRTYPARVLVVGHDAASNVAPLIVGLGRAAAQVNREVLLVDTDFDRPRLHRELGLPNDVGVGSIGAGDVVATDLVRKSDVPGVKLLAAGPRPPDPVELLASTQWSTVLSELTVHFDLVLLTGPGVLHGVTASVLALQASEAVLVLGRAPLRAAAEEAARQLHALPVEVAGVIVCGPSSRFRGRR
jgi:capsular polysaccharide biosynthesis protein